MPMTPDRSPDREAPDREVPDRDDVGGVRRLPLPGARGAVARSRVFTADALLDWRWLPAADQDRQEAAQDVLLLVSELVANACVHTSGPTELTLSRTPERLRIEVGDQGRALPVPRRRQRPGRPGGHGLLIVDRLSTRWGVEQREHGKAVWVEVSAPATPGR